MKSTNISIAHTFWAIAILLCAGSISQAESHYTIDWLRLQGTSLAEGLTGLATDAAGNVYVSGGTEGAMQGTNQGLTDATFSKYSPSGALLWTRQFGSNQHDSGNSMGLDALGNIYVSGQTYGAVGGPVIGDRDIHLSKFDTTGSLLWSRQIGTVAEDLTERMVVDVAGNSFTLAHTLGSLGGPSAGGYDTALIKYDANGVHQWSRQFGSSKHEFGHSISLDPFGNLLIGGYTDGPLVPGNPGTSGDAFLRKYDPAGNVLWTRQTGTGHGQDIGTGVAADQLGNVYLTGYTNANVAAPNQGEYDIFLQRYDAAGNLLWARQYGSATWEDVSAIDTDDAGNAYLAGRRGVPPGGPNSGSYDILLLKYDTAGQLAWISEFGTPQIEDTYGIQMDASGRMYLVGDTRGDLNGEANAGFYDGYVARLIPVPEPSTLGLGVVALALLLWRFRRKSLAR